MLRDSLLSPDFHVTKGDAALTGPVMTVHMIDPKTGQGSGSWALSMMPFSPCQPEMGKAAIAALQKAVESQAPHPV